VSPSGVHEHANGYAVVWRTDEGPTCGGRLELGENDLVLEGAAAPEGLRIPLSDLASVEIGRAPGDRVNGEKSLVLERTSCERVLVAALGGVGLLGEINELLARLRSEQVARARVAVVVPIKRGKAEVARQLTEEGPPFESRRWGSSDTTSSSASAR
jgi:hypothetical protein